MTPALPTIHATAEKAIEASRASGRPVYCADTPGNRALLVQACSDHDTTPAGATRYVCHERGDEWTVVPTTAPWKGAP